MGRRGIKEGVYFSDRAFNSVAKVYGRKSVAELNALSLK